MNNGEELVTVAKRVICVLTQFERPAPDKNAYSMFDLA